MSEVYVTVKITEHGNRNSYAKGCRCDECRRALREYQYKWRVSRKERPEDIPHGTRGGYCNWGCRCDPCTKANSDYMRAWRKKP